MASSRATRQSSRANTPRATSTTTSTPPTASTRDPIAALKPGHQSLRFSSHASSTTTSPAANSRRKSQQSVLDSWVEPPPLKPRPSFEEHGLERQGVVAHMEPLGTPPSAKLKAKLRGDASKRPLPADPSGFGTTARVSRDTPDTLSSGQETRKPRVLTAEDEIWLEEYELDMALARAKPTTETSRTIVPAVQTLPAANKFPISKLERIVRNASARAEYHKNPTTGAAVKKMWHGGMADMSIIPALDGILTKKPSKAHRDVFRAYVKREKRMAKAANEPPQKRLKLSFKQPKKALSAAAAGPATPTTGSPVKKQTIDLVHRTPKAGIQSLKMPKLTSSPPTKTSTPKHHTNGTRMNDDSDSDLSEVDEDILQEPPPDTVAPEGGSSPTSRDSRLRRNVSRTLPASQLAYAFEPMPSSIKPRGRRNLDDADLTEATEGGEDAEEAALIAARRQAALRTFGSIHIPMSQIRPEHSYVPQSHLPPQRASTPRTNGFTTNGEAALSRVHERVKREDGAASRTSSRASTPAGSGPPPLAAGKRANREVGLRTKIIISPQKNKTGVVAGHAPKIGGVDGLGGAADGELQSEEEDICASCSGNGFLLQCDGCDRSFHLTCLDPPRDHSDIPELEAEDWYCYVCTARLEPPRDVGPGLFGPLMEIIEKRNAAAFSLPSHVREFFENVQTGPEGEYEETGNWVRTKMRNGLVDEDPTKLRDSKGTVILCCQCGKSSLDGREIIQCTICQENWHLDCVDPPMATRPPINLLGDKRQAFKCPRHVLHDLRAIDPAAAHVTGLPSDTSGYRLHRLRRPREPLYVEPALQRGFRNNGIIEVINEESDSDSDEFIENEDDEGVVYRLPERGIKLDFIHKAKNARILRQQRDAKLAATHAFNASASAPHIRPITARLESQDYTTAEQQTALNLIQYAQKDTEAGLDNIDVNALIMSLVAEAPDQVVAELTRSQKRVCRGLNGTTSSPAAATSNFDALAFLTRLGNVIEEAKRAAQKQQQVGQP